MIPYEIIFSRARNRINDPQESLLNEADQIEIYTERLHYALSKPRIRRLFSSLNADDNSQELTYALNTSVDEYSDNDFVAEILALAIATSWLEPKVNSLENTASFFGGKEEKKLKDDYALNMQRLKEMKIEQQKIIRDYGYAFIPIGG